MDIILWIGIRKFQKAQNLEVLEVHVLVPALTSGPPCPSLPPQSIQSALTNSVRITSYNDGIEIIEVGVSDQDETKDSE